MLLDLIFLVLDSLMASFVMISNLYVSVMIVWGLFCCDFQNRVFMLSLSKSFYVVNWKGQWFCRCWDFVYSACQESFGTLTGGS